MVPLYSNSVVMSNHGGSGASSPRNVSYFRRSENETSLAIVDLLSHARSGEAVACPGLIMPSSSRSNRSMCTVVSSVGRTAVWTDLRLLKHSRDLEYQTNWIVSRGPCP